MKQHSRWTWLPLLAVPVLLAWLIAVPRHGSGPAGAAHAAVDCGSDGCGAAPRETSPATPQYPAPQVDDNAPPAEPPPTF
jgi:hypothetical protein